MKMPEEPVVTPTEPTTTEPAVEPVVKSEVEPAVDKPAVVSKWPDNWREEIAGKDEKELKLISRYASPAEVWRKARSLEQKLSSGEFKPNTPFPEKGTEDEKNVWRTENGIPPSPEKYDLTFDDGLVIGEDDKPIIDDFLKTAHAKNMKPEDVKANVRWYYDLKEKQAQEDNARDLQVKQQTEDSLRSEWGNDYRANINRIHGLLDTAPEGVKDKIMGARMGDGTPLASDPDTLKFLIDMALQINPATTLVPGSGANIASAIDDEMAKYEKMMGDRSSEYWKGPRADKHQARYRELVAGKERISRKAS